MARSLDDKLENEKIIDFLGTILINGACVSLLNGSFKRPIKSSKSQFRQRYKTIIVGCIPLGDVENLFLKTLHLCV